MKMGSLLLFLLGLATAVRGADEPVFKTTASGLKYAITRPGTGRHPRAGDVIVAHYTGRLEDGTVFDDSRRGTQPFAFTLGRKQVIRGWDEGFELLRVGDRATLVIPPALGYGDQRRGPIPPYATLTFDVELLAVKDRALADHLRELIEAHGVAGAQAKFAELKAAGFGDFYLGEAQINLQGYKYLQKSRIPEAVAVFQWNVELFPDSWNAHDSLAESYVGAGERAKAIASYERSLALEPKNDNAVKMLATLRATPDTPAEMAALTAKLKLAMDFADAKARQAGGKSIGVRALRSKVDAFLRDHGNSVSAPAVVADYLALVESAEPKQAPAEWSSFLANPRAEIRAVAEAKLKTTAPAPAR